MLSLSGCGRGFGSVFHHQKLMPNGSPLGIFFSESRVHVGISAETCGLPILPIVAIHHHISLSPRHYSLRSRSPGTARSPQRRMTITLKFNELRADDSSGLSAALATRRKHPSQRNHAVHSMRWKISCAVRRAMAACSAPRGSMCMPSLPPTNAFPPTSSS